MSPERGNPETPEWAREEREHDLAWIAENRTSFWPAVQRQFAARGRGVIVVDTTQQPNLNAGHPMYYLTQEMIEQMGEADVERMLREYDPQREFVVTLLKPQERTSTYRVQPVARADEKVPRGRPKRGKG